MMFCLTEIIFLKSTNLLLYICFEDLNVHQKDWLTYSSGTERLDEMCFNSLNQMVNFTMVKKLWLLLPQSCFFFNSFLSSNATFSNNTTYHSKVIFRKYNFITKRITRSQNIVWNKIPIDLKLVKLIFRLYFPKNIFKVFICNKSERMFKS